MKKKFLPGILLVAGLLFGALTYFGDGGYAKLLRLRGALRQDQDKLESFNEYVRDLRTEVRGLHTDDRSLEKAARNQLGLAREGEMLFVFENE